MSAGPELSWIELEIGLPDGMIFMWGRGSVLKRETKRKRPNIGSRKTLVTLLWALAVWGLVALPGMAATKLTVGVVWGPGTTSTAGFEPVAQAFMERFPDVEVEIVWETGLSDQVTDAPTAKLLTMLAGGVPPDVVMVGGQSVPQYAVEGFLEPIDAYVQRDGINPRDFVPAAWTQTLWGGQQYAMTILVDPNFALVWKKDAFNEAGLDADRGPRTMTEWEEYFRRLTRTNNEGVITQIGQRPWDVYGNANTIFTWGWIFGGDFYDYESRKVTAAHPRVVEALEFIRDYYVQYNPLLGSVSFPTTGEAMRFAVTSNLLEWVKLYPDIPLGAGLGPYKEGSGSENPAWIGGWAMGIMKDSPNKDLAWEFLKFISATEEGTYVFAKPSGWIPAYLRSPIMEEYLENPYLAVYLQIAQTARFVRPAMPVISRYMLELDLAISQVLNGFQQPIDALRFVEELIQREHDEVLAGK